MSWWFAEKLGTYPAVSDMMYSSNSKNISDSGTVNPALGWRSGLIVIFGFLFAWMYVAKAFFKESYFGALISIDGVFAYCFFLAVFIGLTVVVSTVGRNLMRALQRRGFVLGFGLMGSSSLFIISNSLRNG